MNRNVHWAFALALLPVAACSSGSSSPTTAAAPPPVLATMDSTFLNSAAAGDASELAISQLAMTKARNARIKRFATTVVNGHSASEQQLTTLAQSKGFTPDATMTQDQQGMASKLQADKPAQFDRDYLHDMVVLNAAAVKSAQDEAANGQDADVKTFAQQALPQQQSHLKMARALGGR